MTLKDRLARELEELRQTNMYRSMRSLSHKSGSQLTYADRRYVNLSSNDYLGLAFDAEMLTQFYRSMDADALTDRWALGASSSRLLTGNSPLYALLESTIAELYSKERALVFNSGYHANIGILPALTDKADLILSDKLNHASIIDGLRLCTAEVMRYRHADYEQLESILRSKRSLYRHCIIVTESVFSMDGDVADLPALVLLKQKYDCQLYVDEAHAVACRGKKGLGICEETATVQDIDFIVGTFGKAWASQGAFLATDAVYAEYLINRMRPLIFTTALPPVNLYWTYFVATRLAGLQPQREYLWQLSAWAQSELGALGYGSASASNIQPVMVGGAKDAEILAQHLQSLGFLVFPIRPPTVPAGTSRLRLSLCASMSREQLVPLWSALKTR